MNNGYIFQEGDKVRINNHPCAPREFLAPNIVTLAVKCPYAWGGDDPIIGAWFICETYEEDRDSGEGLFGYFFMEEDMEIVGRVALGD